ncbi:uncharacterized protein LOC125660224 [Ostrea edulis]|uniref:uncharacterized protein LOC125660224 n=1 Tax=Ostrea edulis TaxID=37623 RepID=UPI0024AEFA48|nr:uncharacterized protein LOC125660224 [Ostrea edulis]
MVVLGYISNQTRRFYKYVTNRVERILRTSNCSQWNYVKSTKNPADLGTLGLNSTQDLCHGWLRGPEFLHLNTETVNESFPLINPEQDKEIRVSVNRTVIEDFNLTKNFERFSSWDSLVSAITVLKTFIKQKKQIVSDSATIRRDSELFIIKETQKTFFLDDITEESKSYMAKLLVQHFHEKSAHQGRHVTEGAIRNNDYWIIGAKKLISAVIHKCVICRRLRGKFESQRMADLPPDRITPGPPFSAVGADTFGPWTIVTHRGTNFIGATADLGIDVTRGSVKNYLEKSKIVWTFNAPHSSHMGGVWERMIDLTRRVLDTLLLGPKGKDLTHEVLSTLMAEVTAIINSRPITAVSKNPEVPFVLSPAMLLNQKISGHYSMCTDVDIRDIYKEQWKQVQVLSDLF